MNAYIGTYKDHYGFFNFTISEYDGQLVTPNLPAFLSYKEDGLFQVVLFSNQQCVFYEVIAANNQWIYFDMIDSSGKSPGFIFPSLYGLDKLKRIS